MLEIERVLWEEGAKHKDKPRCSIALGKDRNVLTCSSCQFLGSGLEVVYREIHINSSLL